jgi:hypothetical protein
VDELGDDGGPASWVTVVRVVEPIVHLATEKWRLAREETRGRWVTHRSWRPEATATSDCGGTH